MNPALSCVGADVDAAQLFLARLSFGESTRAHKSPGGRFQCCVEQMPIASFIDLAAFSSVRLLMPGL